MVVDNGDNPARAVTLPDKRPGARRAGAHHGALRHTDGPEGRGNPGSSLGNVDFAAGEIRVKRFDPPKTNGFGGRENGRAGVVDVAVTLWTVERFLAGS